LLLLTLLYPIQVCAPNLRLFSEKVKFVRKQYLTRSIHRT
jgi:hypothetical protein